MKMSENSQSDDRIAPPALDHAALDHIGVAVNSIEEAHSFYRELGMHIARVETIVAEKTKVAMLPLGEARIELLEPTDPDSAVGRFLAKRGPGLHHICLRVSDLAGTVARLKASGAGVINEVPAIGADGHSYVFIHPSSTGGMLVELVEKADAPPA
jgi:methylmalonyl-CoA epimerase